MHASTTTRTRIAPNIIIGMGILANMILGRTHVFTATTGPAQHALISEELPDLLHTPWDSCNWGGCDVPLLTPQH
ncbi:unnamed protein product [Allacma fusca]|uniref:Uncharacterized protein n=1 Tax=Allacma fusca TaxID=39272 RepID=A0A8J2NYZ8_9HEXA|nr:unnamed protein product [Allacma fusca]